MSEQPFAHFVRIAARGAQPGASKAEVVANQLARTLDTIGDDVALLDDSAALGFTELFGLMRGPWADGQAKEAIFKVIRRAAGQQGAKKRKI